ncbi:GNAT family N-acetyltransferase [Embleya sp. NPDC005575]|uniref:GNAT family N-acetyltransferase n=1 Tax=Embleya sp. NPDC005575 TaxID=3156892 RepID=UPI0033A16FAB
MDNARVRLRRLDEDLLAALLDTAVTDADPAEVMPAVPGPPGWTTDRRAAFLAFHHEWAATPTTYAILVADRVVGAARLQPAPKTPDDALETGLWIGRSHRGRGIGHAVVALLRAEAKAQGASRIVASTTEANTAAQRLLTTAGAELHQLPEPTLDGDTIEATLDVD